MDRAEDDVELCRRLNAAGAGNVAACARNIGAGLVHLSTDYVFNGRVTRPAYSVLDKGKIKAALGIGIPAWDASLGKFLQA